MIRHYALLDDTMIELHCSLDEIEKQILEGIEGEIRYDIEAEELSFVSSETISFLLLEVRNNNIKLIGSIDMVAQVRDYKWSLNDYVCELKRQLQYYSDIELNYYELGEEAFMWLETEINTNISLHESI